MAEPRRPRHGAPSSGPRGLVVDALVRVEDGAWSDRLLASLEARLDEPRDRALVHRLVLTTLRWQGALDERLAPLVRGGLARLDAPVRAALRAGLAEVIVLGSPPGVTVSAFVDETRVRAGAGAGGLVNAVLRRAARPGAASLDESATLPAWLFDGWCRAYGPEAATGIRAAMTRPPRPFVVPARGGSDAERVAAMLADEGVRVAPASFHEGGLVVLGGAPQASEAFRRGEIVIVDEAAALVAELARRVDVPGVLVDLTAAPGGKSALLAHAADAPLVALELVAGRASQLAATLARAAPDRPAVAVRADALAPPLPDASCALVLLDAPCTGSGTLRRRPERRHRLREDDVVRAASAQRELLDAAARLVAPGGALVYAVCSLEPEEGRAQVEGLLARHREFRAVDPQEFLPDSADSLVVGDPPMLVTRPDRGELEGFAAARVHRA